MRLCLKTKHKVHLKGPTQECLPHTHGPQVHVKTTKRVWGVIRPDTLRSTIPDRGFVLLLYFEPVSHDLKLPILRPPSASLRHEPPHPTHYSSCYGPRCWRKLKLKFPSRRTDKSRRIQVETQFKMKFSPGQKRGWWGKNRRSGSPAGHEFGNVSCLGARTGQLPCFRDHFQWFINS